MKIKEVDIRDFGIFQGEKLDNLGKGIIVIGGANRAGKTSLMQILRHLPFGFPQNSNLPPYKFEYDVRSDLELESGQSAKVLLKGFRAAEVVYEDELYNSTGKNLYNIDKNTYKELFTISLDELNKNSNKDEGNLQSVLLGAGFKHIVKIPQITKELRDKANVIGGTRGNPSTKMFKPYTENIKKSVEGRKKALLQMDVFSQKKTTLSELEDSIILTENNIDKFNNNIIKLDTLKHNYGLYMNKKQLEIELENYSFKEDIKEYHIEKANNLLQQYIKGLEQYNKHSYEFQREVAEDIIIKDILIENKSEIINFYNELSGMKEITKNLTDKKEEYYVKTQEVMNKMKKANDNWTSFKDISSINCDEIQQNILMQDIENFKKIQDTKEDYNKKLEDLKVQRHILESQLQPQDAVAYIKNYFYYALFFMILGFGVFLKDKLLGCSLIIIGSVGAALYLFIKYSNNKLIINKNQEIKNQINSIDIIFCKTSEEYQNLEDNLEKMNNIIDEYRDILKLDERVSPEGIKDYFRIVQALKDEMAQCNLLKKKVSTQFINLCETLSSINKLIDGFTHIKNKCTGEINLDNIEEVSKDLFINIEQLFKQLLLAENLEKSLVELKLLEQEISELLNENSVDNIALHVEKYIAKGEEYASYVNKQKELKIIKEKLLQAIKSQHIRKVLNIEKNPVNKVEDEKLLEVLENSYKQYYSIDEINDDYERYNVEHKELNKELETFKNEKQTLKNEIERLSSDEMLLQYQETIKEARGELRPLAEKYAIHNTAALFLEKIRERFLINTKDKLLKGASDILSEITSGEYKHILPMEDLMQSDFRTVLQDESIKESSKQLSRGTKEQLFLAVRISRIKEFTPALPVIFDDSFVNFDRAHTKNTVKALVELSKTHQIFVLTCHESIVDLVDEYSLKSQYWKLDKGKFNKTTARELKEHLLSI